jgi:hypothetical protein
VCYGERLKRLFLTQEDLAALLGKFPEGVRKRGRALGPGGKGGGSDSFYPTPCCPLVWRKCRL